jgi:hypothetical protein
MCWRLFVYTAVARRRRRTKPWRQATVQMHRYHGLGQSGADAMDKTTAASATTVCRYPTREGTDSGVVVHGPPSPTHAKP